MHNLIEYSDIYPETSGSLWQYYRDHFPANNSYAISFKCKEKITE